MTRSKQLSLLAVAWFSGAEVSHVGATWLRSTPVTLRVTSSPSDAPSLTPSLVPSLYKPTSAAEKRSQLPSDIPSLSPSYVPSISRGGASRPTSSKASDAAIAPSDTPSLVPSTRPSSKFIGSSYDIPSSTPILRPTILQAARITSDTPSLVPSTHPSLIAVIHSPGGTSPLPTGAHIHYQSGAPPVKSIWSDQPNESLSNMPSITTSIRPSYSMSNLPSLIPSLRPSSLNAVARSDAPSTVPSNQANNARFPSGKFSDNPSFSPSGKSSLENAVVAISDLPSITPSASPSVKGGIAVSGSAIPSMHLKSGAVSGTDPSFIPSLSPTHIYPSQSDAPSMTPSVQPSWLNAFLQASDIPSLVPSTQPSTRNAKHSFASVVPSRFPATATASSTLPPRPSKVLLEPTGRPSVSPFKEPGPIFVSPITNSLLPTVSSNSSPPVPSVVRKEYTTSDVITLTGVTTTMDKTTQKEFQSTAATFLSQYMAPGNEVLNITLQSVTVIKQILVNGTRRKLQAGGLTVDFSIVATAFSMETANFSFATLIRTTFERSEPEFLRSLAEASSFFSTYSVSVTGTEKGSKTSSNGSKTIYVSVAVVTVSAALVFTLGLWAHRRCRGRQDDSFDLDTSAGYISPYPSDTETQDQNREQKMITADTCENGVEVSNCRTDHDGVVSVEKSVTSPRVEGAEEYIETSLKTQLAVDAVSEKVSVYKPGEHHENGVAKDFEVSSAPHGDCANNYTSSHKERKKADLTSENACHEPIPSSSRDDRQDKSSNSLEDGKMLEVSGTKEVSYEACKETEKSTGTMPLNSIPDLESFPKKERSSEGSSQMQKTRILPPALKRDPPVSQPVYNFDTPRDDDSVQHSCCSSIEETRRPRHSFSKEDTSIDSCQSLYLCGLDDEILRFNETKTGPPARYLRPIPTSVPILEARKQTFIRDAPPTPARRVQSKVQSVRDAPPSVSRRDAHPSTPRREEKPSTPRRDTLPGTPRCDAVPASPRLAVLPVKLPSEAPPSTPRPEPEPSLSLNRKFQPTSPRRDAEPSSPRNRSLNPHRDIQPTSPRGEAQPVLPPIRPNSTSPHRDLKSTSPRRESQPSTPRIQPTSPGHDSKPTIPPRVVNPSTPQLEVLPFKTFLPTSSPTMPSNSHQAFVQPQNGTAQASTRKEKNVLDSDDDSLLRGGSTVPQSDGTDEDVAFMAYGPSTSFPVTEFLNLEP